MSVNYEKKLLNHKRFNNCDIRDFCIEQSRINNLDDYVTDLVFKKVLFALASYDKLSHSICLNIDFLFDYKEYKKKYRSKKLIDRFLMLDSDVFNLFIMSTIFHELWHAKQEKEIDEHPDSNYSVIVKASLLFIGKSGTIYNSYHDMFFCEYDAIINSLMLTLDFVRDFDIDKRALFLLNKSYATHILASYGVKKDNSFSDYKSPIDFFRFFFDNKFYISNDEKKIISKLDDSIFDYQPDDSIKSLFRGYPISDSLVKVFADVSSGKVRTLNLLSELDSVKENDNLKRKI